MREIWDDILKWEDSGQPFALARVVETWGSSPRRVGAAMIVGTGMEASRARVSAASSVFATLL